MKFTARAHHFGDHFSGTELEQEEGEGRGRLVQRVVVSYSQGRATQINGGEPQDTVKRNKFLLFTTSC